MYQVRITDPDGTNPIILDKADNISYSKTINSSDEQISFEIPASDGKTSLVNYTKLWEFWDTSANERLNRGPIHTIDHSDPSKTRVEGPGRSQFLADEISENTTTFNAPVERIVEGLRFENVATEPGTNTHVWDGNSTSYDVFFPNGVNIDESQYAQYQGLSKQTSINAVDGDTGDFAIGTNKPFTTYHSTPSYWSGTDVKDSLIIDLGDIYSIAKNTIKFPWWGGTERRDNRTYTFQFAYSSFNESIENMIAANWTTLYETELKAEAGTYAFYYYPETDLNIERYLLTASNVKFLSDNFLQARYFRIAILDTHAWYGSAFDNEIPVDKWGHQCNPDSTDDLNADSDSADYPVMKGKSISDRVLEPQNDCHAGVVEFGAYVEIVERNEISKLINQRVRSDNKNISYSWDVPTNATITVGNSPNQYRRFEPGGIFTSAQASYTGASTSYTKFFVKDCDECYSSFKFAALDQRNSLIYSSNSTSNAPTIECPSYTGRILMKGSLNANIVFANTWRAKVDPLSWGGQYYYLNFDDLDDVGFLKFRFRGRSFKWWATVPDGVTPGRVDIYLRHRVESTGLWSDQILLEEDYYLPINISSEIIYEIPYGHPLLEPDTTYEIEIDMIEGYVSVDSFGGWWEGSMVEENEDSERIFDAKPDRTKQVYDARFSNGSIIKTSTRSGRYVINFWGDRVQIYSAKGQNYGIVSLTLEHHTGTGQFDENDENKVFILEGDVDGSYSIDLDITKKENEIPQALIFDSNDYTYSFGEFGDPMDSLPWGQYTIRMYASKYYDTYFINPTLEDIDQKPKRCRKCGTQPTGTKEVGKPIYLDGFAAHSTAGISAQWKMQTHLDILKSLSETLEFEWDVSEQGLTTAPRLGEDTNIILKEGIQTVITTSVIQDAQDVSTILYSSGSDIDGLPLTSITEDRKNRAIMGRTIKRIKDYRSLADYFTLIGVSRGELKRRKEPEERINVTHVGYHYGLNPGDTFLSKKKNLSLRRVRINQLSINQSKSSGIVYNLECIRWNETIYVPEEE